MLARPWTTRELDTLKLAYLMAGDGKLDLNALAAKIGRSRWGVAMKATRLGLARQSRAHLGPDDAEERARMSDRTRRQIATQGHPRGALGMKHTAATLTAMSEASKRAWATPGSALRSESAAQGRSDALHARQLGLRGKPRGHNRSTTGGPREDLGGLYVRSAWEANYARYLSWLKKMGRVLAWEYEPRTFVFARIKRGTRSYTPDFMVTLAGGRIEWHEVKGWLDQKSRTRLARMRRYYPNEKVVLIGADWFKSARANGLHRLVPNWEKHLP
jgi:hypothetical protein